MSWIAVAAAVSTVAGIGMQARASNQQQSAMASARLQEVSRQGEIMRRQMGLQKQQEEDALRSRKSFQDNTLKAYTRENVEQDTNEQANKFAQALAAAGDQAYAGSMGGDASQSTGTVSVEGATPSAETNSYRNALNTQLSYAQDYGDQQAKAQAALMALGRARELGLDRLRQSGENISLVNSQMSAINRPVQAYDLMSGGSRQLYGVQGEAAANKGAGLMLAGQGMQALGQLGYSAATAGGGGSKAKTPTPKKP
jgi:hypothetical protein